MSKIIESPINLAWHPCPFAQAVGESDSGGIFGSRPFGGRRGRGHSLDQVSMIAGLPCTAVRNPVLTHPTLPEISYIYSHA